MAFARQLRRTASAVRRLLFPSPDEAAWRRACRLSETTPRYTLGAIALNGYRIVYSDLLTLCPQWHDIFVAGSLRFASESPAPRILDCGANIGLSSLYFKKLYPDARITAYEADPAIASICRENLRVNGAGDVDVVASAVWTGTGAVCFQREGADSGAIAGTSQGLHAPSVEVPAVRLRDLVSAERIDLVKLDVEGAEGAVLADCAGALDGVRALVIDLHEFDPARRQTPDVLRVLEAAGFVVSLSDVVPLPWRSSGARGPFAGAAPVWVSTLRAWRE